VPQQVVSQQGLACLVKASRQQLQQQVVGQQAAMGKEAQ
jgi:hypothetical protein